MSTNTLPSKTEHPDVNTVFLPTTQELNVRLLAYLTFAATMGAGVLTEFFSAAWTLAVLLLVAYPIASHFVTAPLRTRLPNATRSIIIVLDAALFGVVIVAFGLTPMLTMLLVILSCAAFIVAGRISTFSTALLSMGIAGAGTWYYFPTLIDRTPSEEMIYVCGAFLGLYVLVSAYYMIALAKTLQTTQLAISEQTESYKTISRKLAKYIAPQVWQTIFSGKKDVRLETTRKRLVVFFSDIQGFTELSEQLEPENLTQIINQYFEEMTRITINHGGTIDKFIGDSIMVFFGDPDTQGTQKDAQACVMMALEMRKKMTELRRRWKQQGIDTELNIRMGINTGFCTVGNFGAESRMDYTIIGKEVNLASRLENSAGPNEILISSGTYEFVKQVASCRPKGEIRAKGFARPVSVYEVVGLRRDLGERSTFTDIDVEGFNMQLDLEKLRHYDREKILTALVKAHKHIKSAP
ncbi:MAG: adenylate cyclase [Natronospirillum sp.]